MILSLILSSFLYVKADEPKKMNVVYCEMIKVKLQDSRISDAEKAKLISLRSSLHCL